MAQIGGSFADVENYNKQLDQNIFKHTDRPQGNELITFGSAPNASMGDTEGDNLLKRKNVASSFKKFEDDNPTHESMRKLIKPMQTSQSPFTLWLYMSSRDRARFLEDMTLIFPDFEKLVWMDMDTRHLICFQLGVKNPEVYFTIVRKFSKFIHKTDPLYPFLDNELLKLKVCINDFIERESGTRYISTTYCKNLDMSPMYTYMADYYKTTNRIKMENWYNYRMDKHDQIKPIPKVDLTDERLQFNTCYIGESKQKYRNFWEQSDTLYIEAVNYKAKGFDLKNVPVDVRQFLDYTAKGIQFNKDITQNHYKQFGHGYRVGSNVQTFEPNKSSTLLIPFDPKDQKPSVKFIPEIHKVKKVNQNAAINFGEQQTQNFGTNFDIASESSSSHATESSAGYEIDDNEEYKKYMIEKLTSLFPNIHFNGESGDMNNSTYTVLNVCFPISNDKAAMLDFQLDLKGIACSKGSACQSGSSEGSHVLSEIQNDSHKTLPSVRFSFSHNNKKEEVDYLIDTLKEFMDS